MRSSRTLDRLSVTFDDDHAVDHAGLVLVATLGQHLGLAELLDERVTAGPHPADKVLTVVHSLLAGGDCIDDVDSLRAASSGAVTGHRVAAPSTVGTFLRSFTPGHVGQLDRVAGDLLTRAWAAEAPRTSCVIDIDSTLCETFGLAKDGARQVMRTGRRGYHPLVAVEAGTGDVVHARLRRGRSNDGTGAARFVTQTLARVARAGAAEVTVRADSGFYQGDVVAAIRRAGARFSIGARIQAGMRRLIEEIPAEGWTPIDYPYGEGAAVAELAWEAFAGTGADRTSGRSPDAVAVRLIVRRVPPSPGLQLPLFPTFSYHPFITDLDGTSVELDAFHRRHAEIENTIKDLKHGMGLNHLPSGKWGANGAWLACNVLAHNLARWVARLGLNDRASMTKTIRRRYLAVPGRLTRSARRHHLHLPTRWPWATQFLNALDRLRALHPTS
jgi:hypothetical protein